MKGNSPKEYKMKTTKTTNYLLLNGKHDLPQWSKEEFISTAMQEFNICKQTAQKVYNSYHEALKKRQQ